MQESQLCLKKWSHFEDREFMANLLKQGENILLIGPPKSGKSELVRDLSSSQRILRINCRLYSKLALIRNNVVKKIMEFLNIISNKIASFSQLINFYLESKNNDDSESLAYRFDTESILIVFENAQNLVSSSIEDTLEFFRNYNTFVRGVSEFVQIQTIVLSTVNIPVEYFKIYLPYPQRAKLKEKIEEVLDRDLSFSNTGDYKKLNDYFRKEFVSHVLGFEILVRDFDSIELITNKLAHFLAADIALSKNLDYESISINKFSDFRKVSCLFYDNIKNIYCSRHELASRIANMDFGQFGLRSDQEAYVKAGLVQSNLMDNLPVIPSYTLLACYLAATFPTSKDSVILGLCKRTLRASSAPVAKIKNEKKLFSEARAIWIIEALIQNQSEREPVNDLALEYHSNEFFLCFDFFERLNWIKSVPLPHGVRRYKFTCEQQFVEKLLDKLGFERKEFIVY